LMVMYLSIMDFFIWDYHDSSGNRANACKIRENAQNSLNPYDIYETDVYCSISRIVDGMIVLFFFVPVIEYLIKLIVPMILRPRRILFTPPAMASPSA